MPKVEDRRTPHTDAWVAALKETLSPYGAQSELARHLCELAGKTDPTTSDITRWVSTFSRWFRRKNLPGAEDLLAIQQWLGTRKKKRLSQDGGRKTKSG